MNWGLVACIIGLTVSMGLEAARYAMLGEILTPDLVLQDRAILRHDRFEENSLAVLGVVVAILAVTAIVFLAWFRRSFRNLLDLYSRDLGFSTGWAIGAWFVPFVNLVRPKQVMDRLWIGSTVAATDKPGTIAQVPLRIHCWWAAFIVASVAERVSRVLERDDAASLAEVVSSQRSAIVANGVAATFTIAAGLLLIRIVRDINGLQQQAAAARGLVTR